MRLHCAVASGCEIWSCGLRKELKPKVEKLDVKGISDGCQPLVLWKNRQFAALHRRYTGEAAADAERLAALFSESNPELAARFALDQSKESAVKEFTAACERFCHVSRRVCRLRARPYFDPKQAGKGRHSERRLPHDAGYFRDDGPLYDLVLRRASRRELDALWQELDFIALVPQRQYKGFIWFERTDRRGSCASRSSISPARRTRTRSPRTRSSGWPRSIWPRPRQIGGGDVAIEAIEPTSPTSTPRSAGSSSRLAAEPSHLASLAIRRAGLSPPAATAERDELLAFYRIAARKGRPEPRRSDPRQRREHPDVAALLLPHGSGRGRRLRYGRLPDYALASRLSYFLWSSMPDEELLARAAARRPASSPRC